MTFIILFITFSGNKFVIYIFGLNLNIRPTLHRSLACLKVQATTAIVEKMVRAFYSTIAVVSNIAVVCCNHVLNLRALFRF